MNKIAYGLALLMVAAFPSILLFVFRIQSIDERMWIGSYMILYGALMA